LNEPLLIWGIVLIVVGFLVLGLEVFVPSGGVLAVTSGIIAIAGIVCLFRYDTTWGLTGTLAVVVIGPLMGAFLLKIWPDTPLGRRLVHGDVTEEDRARAQMNEQNERMERLALVGAEGVAITTLRPVGTAKIGTERMEVLSESGWITAGTPVKVTAVDGLEIKVRQI
jgi:membrane-bound serine protease (ClpP class)